MGSTTRRLHPLSSNASRHDALAFGCARACGKERAFALCRLRHAARQGQARQLSPGFTGRTLAPTGDFGATMDGPPSRRVGKSVREHPWYAQRAMERAGDDGDETHEPTSVI